MVKLVITSTLVLSLTGPFPAEEDSVWRDRFLKEASGQWEKYRARVARLQGSYTWRNVFTRVTPEMRSIWERSYEFKQRDGCTLFVEQSAVEKSQEATRGWLRVVNPRYAFELYRPAPTKPWAVAQFQIDLSQELSFESPIDAVDRVCSFPCGFASIYGSLRDISHEPGFTLEHVSPVVREGQTLAKVAFRYQPTDLLRMPLRGGWILCDPDHYWVIREYEVQIDSPGPNREFSPGSMAATIEYDKGEGGLPILKRITKHQKVPPVTVEYKSHHEFDLREADVPEEDFTLSAFGFPEPLRAAKPPNRWYIWCAVGAVACLGVAVIFRRLARRA